MTVLVTGGAGFIGCNLSRRLAERGDEVVVIDNLFRAGSDRNLSAMLEEDRGGARIRFYNVDLRDAGGLDDVFMDQAAPFGAVVHLAGQTTVTNSLTDPLGDFETNARGTLVLLEAVRRHTPEAQFLFSSTNKVYGDLGSLRTERTPSRYVLTDFPVGIPESFPTNAASPYGCSKLAAESYVRDYARTYGMATTVFRTSCVYGEWQNSMLGQGWVSWMVRSVLLGSELTIFGDGLQVRDLLHVDDCVEAYITVLGAGEGSGEAYNLGGGPAFSLSVWAEFGPLLEELTGRTVPVRYEARRIADQDVYISDHRKLTDTFGWRPHRPPRDGIAALVEWTARQLDF
jgi:CDP-paratose 2-epimerase